MKIIDEDLLDSFRRKPRCEWCKKATRVEAHHVYSRGWLRLDVAINLVSLCRHCHQAHHDGNRPLRCDLLAVVAAREDLLQDNIVSELWRLYRATKGTSRGEGKTDASDRAAPSQGRRGAERLHPEVPPVSSGDRAAGLENDEDGWHVL